MFVNVSIVLFFFLFLQSHVEKKGPLNFQDFFHFIQESEHHLMALFKYMDENSDGEFSFY